MKTALLFVLLSAFLIFGCAHFDRAYLGFHGASVRLHPNEHMDVHEDHECLFCHHTDNAQGPPTPHPQFKGCLNCHNDPI